MSRKLIIFGVVSMVLSGGGGVVGGSVRWANAGGAASAANNTSDVIDGNFDGSVRIRMGISVVESRCFATQPDPIRIHERQMQASRKNFVISPIAAPRSQEGFTGFGRD